MMTVDPRSSPFGARGAGFVLGFEDGEHARGFDHFLIADDSAARREAVAAHDGMAPDFVPFVSFGFHRDKTLVRRASSTRSAIRLASWMEAGRIPEAAGWQSWFVARYHCSKYKSPYSEYQESV